jgi:hypothetical protein
MDSRSGFERRPPFLRWRSGSGTDQDLGIGRRFGGEDRQALNYISGEGDRGMKGRAGCGLSGRFNGAFCIKVGRSKDMMIVRTLYSYWCGFLFVWDAINM